MKKRAFKGRLGAIVLADEAIDDLHQDLSFSLWLRLTSQIF